MSGFRVSMAENCDVAIHKTVARPSHPLTSRAFKYTRAAETDIGKRFDRIRREQKQAEAQQASNVKSIKAARKEGKS